MSDTTDIHTGVTECIMNMAEEARELYLDKQVPVISAPVSPLRFYREHVASNKPVVVEGALQHWPALKLWEESYFRKKIGDVNVSVTVTPNGYADAVTDGKFVMPDERKMTMSKFLDELDAPKKDKVFYIQKQNSNLTEEFSSIISDVDTDIDWGTEAFGQPPDAVNFWMGDGRAVTSMHRDHYENLYCVVRGWKTFILIPPTDLAYVPYEIYQSASYRENDQGGFEIVDDEETGKVPWVAIDPESPDLDRYPQYGHARPLKVTVHAGQMLYLPSLWFHHVSQSHGCIAVNYWYDMQFDIKYNYYKFLENVANTVSSSST
ncbi:bifunctional peptidase and (3S)-lysyl hydroxylase Jmjd7-like [Ylistrum balloti]|uniref:bifunctional peptidase and (3S)-lysyl hydroxylase Jmjd7-like n=1 Tax=Ylistrum balloti TaxID=509963 RepID=UPI0029058D64|nr:bifunctional peptidase and (3S)-lysyl hydroxylase Jmjd7-like [Ylistrum balloti]